MLKAFGTTFYYGEEQRNFPDLTHKFSVGDKIRVGQYGIFPIGKLRVSDVEYILLDGTIVQEVYLESL